MSEPLRKELKCIQKSIKYYEYVHIFSTFFINFEPECGSKTLINFFLFCPMFLFDKWVFSSLYGWVKNE